MSNCLVSWTSYFFHGTLFVSEWMTEKWWEFNVAYLVHIFLEIWSESFTWRKTSNNIFCQWQNLSLQVKIRLWETHLLHSKLDSFLILKDFSEISDNISKCNFFYFAYEMCQHLEDLNNSMNQYFPCMMLQCMVLQNYAQVKNPFKVQCRPIDLT